MNQARPQHKKQITAGKFVVGIDPAKRHHQATIINPIGIHVGKSFSFPASSDGYTLALWKNIEKCLSPCNKDTVLFAVETCCNLWQTIAFYLHSLGYTVLMVSPLSTYHERPIMNHDFSRTDPKDAFHIATIAQRGGPVD